MPVINLIDIVKYLDILVDIVLISKFSLIEYIL